MRTRRTVIAHPVLPAAASANLTGRRLVQRALGRRRRWSRRLHRARQDAKQTCRPSCFDSTALSVPALVSAVFAAPMPVAFPAVAAMSIFPSASPYAVMAAIQLARGGDLTTAARLLFVFERLEPGIGSRRAWVTDRNDQVRAAIDSTLSAVAIAEAREDARTMTLDAAWKGGLEAIEFSAFFTPRCRPTRAGGRTRDGSGRRA